MHISCTGYRMHGMKKMHRFYNETTFSFLWWRGISLSAKHHSVLIYNFRTPLLEGRYAGEKNQQVCNCVVGGWAESRCTRCVMWYVGCVTSMFLKILSSCWHILTKVKASGMNDFHFFITSTLRQGNDVTSLFSLGAPGPPSTPVWCGPSGSCTISLTWMGV